MDGQSHARGVDAEQTGQTPTFRAAEAGHAECIHALVRHGADVNKADVVSAGRYSTRGQCGDVSLLLTSSTAGLQHSLQLDSAALGVSMLCYGMAPP